MTPNLHLVLTSLLSFRLALQITCWINSPILPKPQLYHWAGVGWVAKKKNLTIKTEQEKLYFTHTTVSHKCDIYHILYIYVKYSLDGPWFH